MKTFLKQLFCKHEYTVIGIIEAQGYFTYFIECKFCGKRKVIKSSMLVYSKQLRTLINMWKKHEIEINFEEKEEKGV